MSISKLFHAARAKSRERPVSNFHNADPLRHRDSCDSSPQGDTNQMSCDTLRQLDESVATVATFRGSLEKSAPRKAAFLGESVATVAVSQGVSISKTQLIGDADSSPETVQLGRKSKSTFPAPSSCDIATVATVRSLDAPRRKVDLDEIFERNWTKRRSDINPARVKCEGCQSFRLNPISFEHGAGSCSLTGSSTLGNVVLYPWSTHRCPNFQAKGEQVA